MYTGIAIDVEQRLEQHRSGVGGAKYLRGRGPLKLEFQEVIGDRSLASRAEHRVKQLARADKQLLIRGKLSLQALLEDVETQASGVSGG